jgi:AraC family transcriptional regulator
LTKSKGQIVVSKDEMRDEARVVNLEPMRFASVYGFGEQPEHLAWSKLEAWAGPKGYLDDLAQHRVFGFNNPNPSPGSPNYGYEFWIAVGPEVEPDGEVRIVGFGGGAYAVLRVEVADDAYEAIPEGWKRLHGWCEEQGLGFGNHQWLEEHLSAPGAPGGFTLDLYMPILK